MNKQELNQTQVEQLTNQVVEGELSDEELENVDGGFFGSFYPSFYPAYPVYPPMDTDTFIRERIYGDPTGTDTFIRDVIYG